MRADWGEDGNSIKPLLCIIPAYNDDNDDLYTWLGSCIGDTNDVNVLSALRQYANWIRFLGGEVMDTFLLEKFFEKIKDKDYGELKSYS